MITFISFLIITFLCGYALKESMSDVLPVTLSVLLLILYILGLCGNMNFIAIISFLVILIMAVSLGLMDNSGRTLLFREFGKFYLTQSSIVIIVGIICVAALTSGHVATWWDDVNFWATDAKALYYLNGFTGKYGNVAPEFGDYPPAIQLIKWCFAKLSMHDYKEGLTFAGYYVMNIIFCLPLLRRVRDKNLILQVIGFGVIFLLPGVCNDVWSHGACADVTMGIVNGALLIAIFDIEGHKPLFYYGRIALFMSVLTLCKSVGFEWMLYAMLLAFIMTFTHGDIYVREYGEKYRIYTISAIMTGASVQLSWWIYCLLNKRIAKLTSSGAHIVTGKFNLPDNAIAKARLYIEGFSLFPMHTNRTAVIDLSALAMILIVFATIIVLAVLKKTDRKETILLAIYTLTTFLISYGIIFIGHITVFAGESQYDTADVMAISISRYAAPFTIGMLMLLIYMISDRMYGRWWLIGCAVFVLATTDYTAAAYSLWGYRNTRNADIEARASMIDDNGIRYIETVAVDTRLPGHRVLYFRDDTVIHWVKDTYINYEAAPVPTVYAGINPATMTADDISNKIKELHAEYIYMEDVSHLEEIPFADIVKPLMAEGDTFQYETVYKVINNGLENRVNLIAK